MNRRIDWKLSWHLKTGEFGEVAASALKAKAQFINYAQENGNEDKMTRSQPRKRDAELLKSATPSHRRIRNANAKHIELLCREIASKFHPDKIILFGSRAYGKPRPESDVDLLIVMPYEGSPFKQAGVIINHLINTVGIVPIDVLVRTSKEVQARIGMGDRFISEIMKRGRVMYEANHE